MTDIFTFRKPEITFDENYIRIVDDAAKQRYIWLFTAVIWIFNGAINFIRYLKTDDDWTVWPGLVVGVIHFVLLFVWLSTSVKSEIPLSEVKSMAIKERFGNKTLVIRLKNNQTRRVQYIDNAEELEGLLNKNWKEI